MKVKKSKKRVRLQAEMIWNAEPDNKPTDIIKEKTKITVFRAMPQYRILDFDINLLALVDNLKIGGSDDPKGYGGFCLRLKLPKGITFVSENKTVIPEETRFLQGHGWI